MTAARRRPVTLLLVRHGRTDWNEEGRLMGRSDVPLNGRGRAQAEALAAALAAGGVDAVVSSPQLRARQTAEPIARAAGVDVVIDPDLDEVWLGPRWQGRTVPELRGDAELERLLEDPTYETEQIEPASAVQRRMVRAAGRLATERAGERVVVVSHGDPLRLLLAHELAMPLAAFRRLTVDNGSLSIVRRRLDGPIRVRLVNGRPGPDALAELLAEG